MLLVEYNFSLKIEGLVRLFITAILMASNRGSVYPKMHQMQPFEANIFKIFQGSMPLDPPIMQFLWPLLPITIANLPTTQKLFYCAAKQGRSITERLRGCNASVVNLWGEQQSPHMYVLHTYFYSKSQSLLNLEEIQ